MKHNYRTISHIPLHIFHHIPGSESATIVTCNKVIHHDLIMLPQRPKLPGTKPAVGRPKQYRVRKPCPFCGITHIAQRGRAGSFKVMKRVIADGVTTLSDLLQQPRIPLHILTNHKKGGSHAESVKHVKNPRRYLRYRSVIKSQEDPLLPDFRRLYPEYCPREKQSEYTGRLLYQHDGMMLSLQQVSLPAQDE